MDEQSNGTVSEDRLTSIAMPNGHTITFTWGNGTTAPTNRIYQAKDNGNRRTVAYSTPDGTSSWGYGDYIRVGDPTSPTPAFQTLVKLSSGVGTAEEIHYAYDSAGRLMHSAFAQSKQTRSGAPTSYPFYTSSYPAETRARASYDYDALGHVLGVSHWWDAMNSGHTAYVASPILKNDCSYDSVKGLKTASAYYEAASGSWPSTATTSESYTYDSYLDYLTGESDTTGGSTTSQSWSYDAAGNRSNSGYSYDDLNRMTASPTAGYTNDIVGNRSTETTSAGTITYAWDVLNRMTTRTGTTAATTGSYEYRADGMRTWKRSGTSVSGYNYELTRHDGTMPFEIEKIGTSVTATRNVIGARGIDAEETVTGTIFGTTRTLGASTIGYPLYDAHGNRITTLARSGTTWTCNTPRYYDTWGNVRSGSTTGGSPLRYCANIRHLQDDESGLVYMRARYYEPSAGRFLNEDPSRAGLNWFTSFNNNPTSYTDDDGRESSLTTLSGGFILFGFGLMGFACCRNPSSLVSDIAGGIAMILTAIESFTLGMGVGLTAKSDALGLKEVFKEAVKFMKQELSEIIGGTEALGGLVSRAIIALGGAAIATYGYFLWTQGA